MVTQNPGPNPGGGWFAGGGSAGHENWSQELVVLVVSGGGGQGSMLHLSVILAMENCGVNWWWRRWKESGNGRGGKVVLEFVIVRYQISEHCNTGNRKSNWW